MTEDNKDNHHQEHSDGKATVQSETSNTKPRDKTDNMQIPDNFIEEFNPKDESELEMNLEWESDNYLELHKHDLDDKPVITPRQDTMNASSTVAVIVGKWAMPTTVLLVLITCVSGFYLDETKFTPVVGMIAPVVMALIMVIREASVGKDQDTTLLNSESERKERREQHRNERDIQLAQMQTDERLKAKELQEQMRQFDMFHNSTRDVLELVRENNNKMAQQIDKAYTTELQVGETHIKIGSQGAEINTSENKLPKT